MLLLLNALSAFKSDNNQEVVKYIKYICDALNIPCSIA